MTEVLQISSAILSHLSIFTIDLNLDERTEESQQLYPITRNLGFPSSSTCMNLSSRNIENYSEKEITEEYKENSSRLSENWPYEFTPRSRVMYDGYEVYTTSENGDQYMGHSPRRNIEEERNDLKTYLGYSEKNGSMEDIYVDSRGMARHTAIFGQNGYGKSSLLRNILVQTANRGHGFCYIDPKGDDAHELMKQIPPGRLDDVELIQPDSDRDNDFSINPFLTMNNEDDKKYEHEVESLAGDITEMIVRASENELNHRAVELLSDIIERLIKSDKKYGLENLAEILETIVYDHYYSYLPNAIENIRIEYPEVINNEHMVEMAHLGRDEFSSILRSLGKILEFDFVNDQPTDDDRIQVVEAVQQGKIVILDTSSLYSNTDLNFLSSLVVSRVWSSIKNSDRSIQDDDNYILCIDEFERTLGDEFNINSIISQARSFGLSVVVSCQYPSQLSDDVKQGIKQVQSILSFHVGTDPRDQQEVAEVLGSTESWKLSDLDRFQVFGRVYMNGNISDPMMFNTYGEYPNLRSEEDVERIIYSE